MGSHFGARSVFLLLLALTIIQRIHAIQYSVSCVVWGEPRERFEKEVGEDAAISIMKRATDLVWEEVLEQSSSDLRKDVQIIHLEIGAPMGQKDASSHYQQHPVYHIHLNEETIKSCPEGQVEKVITPLIYFEIACILQWRSDDGKIMTNSIAYFATLKAKYQTSNMVGFGEGDKWYQSAEVTAQFLVYCSDRKSGFVPFLNNNMCKSSFRESYFKDYFNKNIDDLWKDYKNKYGVQT